MIVVCFDVVPCVKCAAFSQGTLDDKTMSVDDLKLMGVAMTDHTLTTLVNVQKKSGLGPMEG